MLDNIYQQSWVEIAVKSFRINRLRDGQALRQWQPRGEAGHQETKKAAEVDTTFSG
jgi:hypothetical protein